MPKRFVPARALCAFLLCAWFVGVFTPCLSSLFADDSSAVSESEAELSAPTVPVAEVPPPSKEVKRIEKWIPDQKILMGAPPTLISLSEVIAHFQEIGAFGTDEPIDLDQVQVKVVQNTEKEVVTPEIVGDQLRLIWNGSKAKTTNIILEFSYHDHQVYDSFSVEVWKPEFWMMGLVVLGGLGMFILGMKNFSEGTQRLAGSSLRRMIAMFTEHRIFAFGTGILVTSILQSSSVTTVMTIGFVNTQFISLSQATGVILGANIGTTITGWILTLNVSAYSLPLIGVSALVYVLFKNERIKNLAFMLMGLGFLFFGLKVMGEGFSSLKELPEFSAFLQMFSADSFSGRLKCVLAGCLLTILIQSSSAAIGIVMTLSMIGAIGDLPTAIAIVLGENIGTTVTALFASIGTSINAKRAAIFHTLFNVSGVCWVLALFEPFFMPLIEQTAHLLNLPLIPAGIALGHTLFNVTNALLFLPFTKTIAGLLTLIIPEREKTGPATETGLDLRYIESPLIAVLQSRLIIGRMGERCRKLGEIVFKQVRGPLESEKEIQYSFREEEALDRMQDEIISFTSKILSKNPTADVAQQVREQIRMADEIESVSDYFILVLKSALKLKNDGLEMPEFIRVGFDDLDEKTLLFFKDINRAYGNRVKARYFLEQFYSTCRSLTAKIKELRTEFMMKMEEEHYDPLLIVAVNSQLTFYRRICEHLLNIAEVFCGAK
ncbi:MAG: Na/Pi cotransporter family protein [Thermoguttaceae bacterium]